MSTSARVPESFPAEFVMVNGSVHEQNGRTRKQVGRGRALGRGIEVDPLRFRPVWSCLGRAAGSDHAPPFSVSTHETPTFTWSYGG
jgi:hypothetical protein